MYIPIAMCTGSHTKLVEDQISAESFELVDITYWIGGNSGKKCVSWIAWRVQNLIFASIDLAINGIYRTNGFIQLLSKSSYQDHVVGLAYTYSVLSIRLVEGDNLLAVLSTLREAAIWTGI